MRELARQIPAGSVTLDLGCGATMPYKEYFRSLSVDSIGADVFEPGPEGHYYRVVNNTLPFPDAHFDAVFCMNVIEHFDHVEAMFSEIARVTREGGMLGGACAFHEMEHQSFFHLSRLGLQTLCRRHGFEITYLRPSEYSGAVLAAQRHFGGPGRIIRGTTRLTAITTLLGVVNIVPFLVANILEFTRRLSPKFDPFQSCATLYFFASRTRVDG